MPLERNHVGGTYTRNLRKREPGWVHVSCEGKGNWARNSTGLERGNCRREGQEVGGTSAVGIDGVGTTQSANAWRSKGEWTNPLA